MSIYKLPKLHDFKSNLDKRWFVGYSFKHPDSGKFELFRIWISSKHKTRAARYDEAKRLIEIWKNRLVNGFNPYAEDSKKVRSINEALELVLTLKQKTTKERTYQSYKSAIKKFKTWLISNKMIDSPVETFTKVDALEYMDYMISSSNISGRTYNNNLVYLKTIFKELYAREYISRDPFLNIKKIAQNETGIASYTIQELRILRSSIEPELPGLWLFCQFVFYCGIRPAELVRLKIQDLDLANGKVTIQSYNSKNRKTQVVNLPWPLLEYMKKFDLSVYPGEFHVFSKSCKPGEKKVAPVRYSEKFREILDKIGFPRSKKLYDLKHTGVGMVIENGANLNDLKIHLRHHDLSITDKYAKRFKSSVSDEFLSKYPIIDDKIN